VLSVRAVPFDDPDARRLWEEEWAELEGRYGPLPGSSSLVSDGVIASFVGYVGDDAVGTVVVRWFHDDDRPPEAEIKRLYVRPERRGNGVARVLMGAAEDAARRAGATRIILETGDRQPEAVALYQAIGYRLIGKTCPWASSRYSICMEKDVPTRVLVVSGTIGAGKSAVAAAVSDLLTKKGARHGWVDGDALAQAEPPAPGDRYNQGLFFEALDGVAPAYRKRGFGLVVIARVVEDPEDRERYAAAFSSEAGPAEVAIVRVTAPEDVRLARIEARDRDPAWREWSRTRTIELEDSLDALDLEDFTIENVGRSPSEAAAVVIDAVGW
jgi:GNAT superfamily N-acetyltransferase